MYKKLDEFLTYMSDKRTGSKKTTDAYGRDISRFISYLEKEEITSFADVDKDVAFDYINAHIPMFKETEVELHWRVRSMSNLIQDRKLQKWMEEHEGDLLNTTIELPNGVGAIPVVPSLSLNRYYILLHCYNHIFSEGLGLRQIMDLYFVLVQNTPNNSKDTEFKKFFLVGLERPPWA